MGKPPSPGPRPYPEDPDAVSLHTTPGESSYADAADEDVLDAGAALLPSYNDAVTETFSDTTAPSAAVGAAIPNESEFLLGITSPDTHFAFTSDSAFKKRTSIGNEVVHVQDVRSDADPQVLEDWIRFMAKHPPAPYLHIRGEHSEIKKGKDGKDKRETVTDFRIMINLQNYLWPNFEFQNYSSTKLITAEPGQKTYRGTVFKTRQTGAKGDLEVGHDKPSLKEWCHRYCAKATGTKVFRLSRTVTGMDIEFLRDRLSGIIRSTNYKGRIFVQLPVADRAVDIYSSSRLNNWRLTGWICWIFYLTFLWIFSWPVLFFMTKRYRVVQVEWPFSQMQPDGQKRYTTVSEEQWISRYGPAIKTLCLDRYNGLAGDAFLSEVLARGDVNEANNPINARAAMSAASAAFQGGRFTAANGASSLMQFAGVATDQVGWGFDT